MAYKLTLENSAGVLDCRIVETEEETRAAALDLVAGMAYLQPGDLLRVVETAD